MAAVTKESAKAWFKRVIIASETYLLTFAAYACHSFHFFGFDRMILHKFYHILLGL